MSEIPAWSALDSLAGFAAAATIYVDLEYGSGDDAFSARDNFPAHVRGHFDGDRAVVDDVSVDTSSFYQ